MEHLIFSPAERDTRRRFMKKSLVCAAGLSAGGIVTSGCGGSGVSGRGRIGRSSAIEGGKRLPGRQGKSEVSFVTGADTREAAFRSLEPLEETVANALRGKQVVIKPNAGVMGPSHRHEVADVDQLRGILDFLAPLYDGRVIIAEGAASQAISMFLGYEEYGYTALAREYNVKLIDANDMSTTTRWILAGYHRPQPINLIDLYFDPDVYLISACRMKTSGGVLVTLSIKNITMGAPVCHYRKNKQKASFDMPPRNVPRGLNEKAKMHGGLGSKQGRELTYNIFTVAAMGAYADLAVIDGVYGADGNGPWNADPVEHGVAVASNDCVAADRLASELMGVDYEYLPYIQWCARAGIGTDDPGNTVYHGPDYKPYIRNYRLNANADDQIEWILELKEKLPS